MKIKLWHVKLRDLIRVCNKQGISVKFVPDAKTRDYCGMNPLAAKTMGYKMPQKTFYVDRNQSNEDKYHILKHELIEYNLMKDKNMKYFPAHEIALDNE